MLLATRPVFRFFVLLCICPLLLGAYGYQQQQRQQALQRSENPLVWEHTISAFEQGAAVSSSPKPVDVLFLGSASIRLWRQMSEDMQPLTASGRGFGGAKILDVSHFLPRLVAPFQPRAVVISIGAEDLDDSAGNRSKTFAELSVQYRRLLQQGLRALPDTDIYFVALRPSPDNWRRWGQLSTVNKFLYELSREQPRLHYLDANRSVYDRRFEPDAELYASDRKQLNREGYRAWGGLIRQRLLADLQ